MAHVRRDGTWVKKQRINQIRKMLNGIDIVSLSRFIAICEVNMGLNPKTARKYLKPLEALGYIEIDETQDLIIEKKPEASEA